MANWSCRYFTASKEALLLFLVYIRPTFYIPYYPLSCAGVLFGCFRLPCTTFKRHFYEILAVKDVHQAFVIQSLCKTADSKLRSGPVDADETTTQETSSVHQTTAGWARAGLRLQHVHHEADPLGTVTAARSDREAGQNLVSEQAHERQEADAETGETPFV